MTDARHGALRISGSGLPGGTTVQLDGQDIGPALSGLSLSIGVDQVPTATLHVIVHDLSTDVENPRIALKDETRNLLLALGWTPPAQEDD